MNADTGFIIFWSAIFGLGLLLALGSAVVSERRDK